MNAPLSHRIGSATIQMSAPGRSGEVPFDFASGQAHSGADSVPKPSWLALRSDSVGLPGRLRGFVEATHSFKVLGVRSAAIGFGLRVDTCRADLTYGIGDVLGSKTASQDSRSAHQLDDATTNAPVVGGAQRPDLAI